jgi:hypothetical protein
MRKIAVILALLMLGTVGAASQTGELVMVGAGIAGAASQTKSHAQCACGHIVCRPAWAVWCRSRRPTRGPPARHVTFADPDWRRYTYHTHPLGLG